MSKKSHKLPKYGLHKTTGQARVVLSGRSHYLGQYGTKESHQNYERLISCWLANNRALPQEAGGPSDLTVNELVLAYL